MTVEVCDFASLALQKRDVSNVNTTPAVGASSVDPSMSVYVDGGAGDADPAGGSGAAGQNYSRLVRPESSPGFR